MSLLCLNQTCPVDLQSENITRAVRGGRFWRDLCGQHRVKRTEMSLEQHVLSLTCLLSSLPFLDVHSTAISRINIYKNLKMLF